MKIVLTLLILVWAKCTLGYWEVFPEDFVEELCEEQLIFRDSKIIKISNQYQFSDIEIYKIFMAGEPPLGHVIVYKIENRFYHFNGDSVFQKDDYENINKILIKSSFTEIDTNNAPDYCKLVLEMVETNHRILVNIEDETIPPSHRDAIKRVWPDESSPVMIREDSNGHTVEFLSSLPVLKFFKWSIEVNSKGRIQDICRIVIPLHK